MSIHVVQGEREMVSDCRSLAKFELRGIPPMVAGAARIRVTFQVDADGLLSVAAREKSTGVESSVVVKPSYGLSDDEIARMLRASQENAQSDMAARALREQQVEAGRLIEAIEAALKEDGERLLNAAEMAEIEAGMAALRSILEGADHLKIKERLEQLNQITEVFAARRMDQSVQKALTGHKLEELET
jgi:molecular chaperone HscA